MGILRASNSHPPQRDLAHGCGRSDNPGLNETALLRFWLPAFWARDAPAHPFPLPAPLVMWEPGQCGRKVQGSAAEQLPERCLIPWGAAPSTERWVKPPPDCSRLFQLSSGAEVEPSTCQPRDRAGVREGQGEETWRFPGAGCLPAPPYPPQQQEVKHSPSSPLICFLWLQIATRVPRLLFRAQGMWPLPQLISSLTLLFRIYLEPHLHQPQRNLFSCPNHYRSMPNPIS